MPNNTKQIFHAIYCLINLVTFEAGDQDALVDIIHFCFEIQVNSFLRTPPSHLLFSLRLLNPPMNNKENQLLRYMH